MTNVSASDLTIPYYLQPDEEDEDGSFGSSINSGFRTPPDGAAAPTPAAAPVESGGVTVRSSAASPAISAPPPPVIDRSNLQNWENRRAIDSQVSSGKAVQPKWWERALGGVASGAMAFGHVPGAVEGGQNITNRRFNKAENERAGRLAEDNAQIQAAQGDINAQNQSWEQGRQHFIDEYRATSANALEAQRRALEQQRLQAVAPGSEAPDDPNNPLGSWHATTVGGSRIATQPPDSWLKSPAGISAQREADVKRLGLTGDDAKFYRANGKLHEPVPNTSIHIPSAESQAYNDSLRAWKREHPGKQPGVEDLRQIRMASEGKSETGGRGTGKTVTPAQWQSLIHQRDDQYRREKAQFDNDMLIAQDPEEKRQIKAAFDGRLNDLQNEWNDRLSTADPEGRYAVQNPSSGQRPSVQPQQQAVAPTQQRQSTGASDKVTRPIAATASQPVIKKAPQPGAKLTDIALAKQYLQKSGGDKAKARQMASQDGWAF